MLFRTMLHLVNDSAYLLLCISQFPQIKEQRRSGCHPLGGLIAVALGCPPWIFENTLRFIWILRQGVETLDICESFKMLLKILRRKTIFQIC